jgi:hypothetical protein
VTAPTAVPSRSVATRPPAGPTASQLLAGVDPTDATSVGAVFARGSWSIDAATDRSEADAEARLASLLTPALAAQVEAAAAGVHSTAAFAQWREHRAVTTASVAQTHDSGAPADTTTGAHRSFAITVTARGRDGWVAGPFTTVEFITLSRPGPGEPWLIADVH